MLPCDFVPLRAKGRMRFSPSWWMSRRAVRTVMCLNSGTERHFDPKRKFWAEYPCGYLVPKTSVRFLIGKVLENIVPSAATKRLHTIIFVIGIASLEKSPIFCWTSHYFKLEIWLSAKITLHVIRLVIQTNYMEQALFGTMIFLN